MSTEPRSDYSAPQSQDIEVVPSALDLKRDELIERLRSARAALSPKAAVAAAAQSGDVSEAAELAASVARQLPVAGATSGFYPRSMTMKLILERPDITLRLVIALATLFFGARAAARFGSAAALVRAFQQTFDGIKGGAAPPST